MPCSVRSLAKTTQAAVLLVAASISSLVGCVMIPIPTWTRGADLISKDAVAAIQPQNTTRTDVLMRLGDPTKRFADDRFFAYEWEEGHGILLIAVPGGGYDENMTNRHLLLVEFAPDGIVCRSTSIKRYWKEAHIWDDAEKWMNMTERAL